METKRLRKIFGVDGFTLVELLVVITILVILGTIAFVNIGNFAGSARDSARISNLTNLQKGLSLFQVVSGSYPMPENAVIITASGVAIGYQGFAKDQVASIAKLSVGATKDPLDANMYTTYVVNANQTKMQLMGFLEDGSNVTAFVPTAYASASSNYSKRTPTLKGDTLGILLGNSGSSLNQPVQETTMTGVDIMATQTGYTAYFSNKSTISGTGTKLMSLKASFIQKNDPMIYDSSLVGYWDMETTTPDGKLADLSGNGNSGSGVGGITIGGTDGNGKMWKATTFDGANDYIDLGTFDPSSGDMTLSFWLYKDSYNSTNPEEIIAKRDGWASDLSDHRWAFYIQPTTKLLRFGRYGFGTSPTNQAKLGSWTHYSFTYSTGSTSKWYENGTLAETWTSFSFWNKTNARISIWRAWSESGEYLLWKLDEVRIYNRALSDSEIQALYSATK